MRRGPVHAVRPGVRSIAGGVHRWCAGGAIGHVGSAQRCVAELREVLAVARA